MSVSPACLPAHADHYENMYAVLQGTKVFTLLPPSDVYRMALRWVLPCSAAWAAWRMEACTEAG